MLFEILAPEFTFLQMWPIVLGVVILAYLIQNVRSYWRLKHFPGPWLAAWTSIWNIRVEMSGQNYREWAKVCDKYGPIVRIAPNTLITCDEELIRRLNAARSPYQRDEWFRAIRFDADKENILSEIDPERHANMRSKVATSYSGKDNFELESTIDKLVIQLVNLIKRKYISTPTTYCRFDLAQTIQYFTLDVITSLSMSQPFGFIENDEDIYDYCSIYERMIAMMALMVSMPMLNRLMRVTWFKRLSIWMIGDKVGIGKTKVVARELISRRFGEGREIRKDMIQSFISHGLTLQECVDESLIQILAGSDTTSTTLRTCLLLLISNPRALNTVRCEISSLSPPLPPTSKDPDFIIPDATAKSMPFLQACIKETLRLYPVGVGLILKDAPPEGDTLPDGTFIPGGTAIGQCAWRIFRNKTVFGEDAEVWRPERWIELADLASTASPFSTEERQAAKERLTRMDRTCELSFGYGQYKCLGERIARIELGKCIVEIVRRFEIQVEDVKKPIEREICYGLFLQRGLWCRVEERKEQETKKGLDP